MYIPEYFDVRELVSPITFQQRREKSLLLLDDRALVTLDRLRERYGVLTVNNWHLGGSREWSGLRTKESPYFSQYSQHTFGRAFDCIFKEVSANEVRQDIIAGYDSDQDFEFINAIELGTSWLHFDVRNTERLMRFKA